MMRHLRHEWPYNVAMKKPTEPAEPPANGPPRMPVARRVLFLHPVAPLTAEVVCERLEQAGIDRALGALRTLTEVELLLVYDYVERLFRSSCDGRVHTRPRPFVLDAINFAEEAPGSLQAP